MPENALQTYKIMENLLSMLTFHSKAKLAQIRNNLKHMEKQNFLVLCLKRCLDPSELSKTRNLMIEILEIKILIKQLERA